MHGRAPTSKMLIDRTSYPLENSGGFQFPPQIASEYIDKKPKRIFFNLLFNDYRTEGVEKTLIEALFVFLCEHKDTIQSVNLRLSGLDSRASNASIFYTKLADFCTANSSLKEFSLDYPVSWFKNNLQIIGSITQCGALDDLRLAFRPGYSPTEIQQDTQALSLLGKMPLKSLSLAPHDYYRITTDRHVPLEAY